MPTVYCAKLSSGERRRLKEALRARLVTGEASIVEVADQAERLGLYAEAWEGLSAVSRTAAGAGPEEWNGESLESRTIVVEQRIRHIAAPIRTARVLGMVARKSGRCIVRSDARLMPLLGRTFPDIEIVDQTGDHVIHYSRASYRSSYETLCHHFLAHQASIESSFKPLSVEPTRRQMLHQRYRQAGRASIGISWVSRNPAKDVLTQEEWIDLLRHIEDAHFVSVQYDDHREAADFLGKRSGRSVIWDSSVDQMQDLDGFAAQLAALDAVISISNSACHLAGALGIPTVVLLDCRSQLIWQIGTAREPWYPSLRKVWRCKCTPCEWPSYRTQILAALKAVRRTRPQRTLEGTGDFPAEVGQFSTR